MTHRGRDIAVIGVGGRYPHADDLEQLWSVLREDRDCVTEVPADRWDTGGPAQWSGFLDERSAAPSREGVHADRVSEGSRSSR
ncbi:hypothetical protein KBY55_23170 [Streptomyces sp. b94]|uniref:beta-ketoacyl synthase N-terminal-like domain-containing protein n=1 Tax=Streptomyces sp. b94 TaxID=1827634 RepID=UPI001B35CFD4|nr:hypothetical protein [Streptomyces sp. b94]